MFETQLRTWVKSKVIGLSKDYGGLESDYRHSKLEGHCLKRF